MLLKRNGVLFHIPFQPTHEQKCRRLQAGYRKKLRHAGQLRSTRDLRDPGDAVTGEELDGRAGVVEGVEVVHGADLEGADARAEGVAGAEQGRPAVAAEVRRHRVPRRLRRLRHRPRRPLRHAEPGPGGQSQVRAVRRASDLPAVETVAKDLGGEGFV